MQEYRTRAGGTLDLQRAMGVIVSRQDTLIRLQIEVDNREQNTRMALELSRLRGKHPYDPALVEKLLDACRPVSTLEEFYSTTMADLAPRVLKAAEHQA
jgi:hypothetical protein